MNALDFALKMELDGENYYKELSEKNKDNSLHVVFDVLAEEEEYHYKFIKEKISKSMGDLKRNKALGESRNVFDMSSKIISEIKATPDQMDAYVLALGFEKKSVELYGKLLAEATNDDDKNIFEALVKEEQSHYNLIEDMIDILIKPKDWVEAAEFGITKEY